ncbi:MAG: cation diffusion facilitator family transporter [candidate division Zixibacteria bacterium]|nr:cation diffusion facilitator family transporter [candidate division Zixibacteria bacterium]
MSSYHLHNRDFISNRKLVGAILLNLGITLAEIIGGLISGYLALLADAVHNLSDVASLILAWLGLKASQLPATKKSTYGYKRVEVMTAFISAIALVVIAVFISIEAYQRLMAPQPITHPGLFLTVAVIGLLGNFFSIWLLHSERGKSLNLKTAFLHLAYDTLSSVVVIIGGIVILYTGRVIIDVILSCLIAVMILWSSYGVIKEAVLIFLEAVPERLDFDQVHRAILGVEKVREVHDLHIWSLSSNEIALSCHVCVNEDDYAAGQAIVGAVNSLLSRRFGIRHSTIQVGTGACLHPDLLCSQFENESPGDDKR